MEIEIKQKPRIGLARNLARKLLNDVGIKEPPISLWKIIKHLQKKYSASDLNVISFNFGEKVSGMLVLSDEQATIGYNPSEHWYRRRFTIAHEIGHFLLGHTCNKSYDDDNFHETEANHFAAELLMPIELLKKDCGNGYNLENIARRYTVSKEAMCRKLMSANLLTKL